MSTGIITIICAVIGSSALAEIIRYSGNMNLTAGLYYIQDDVIYLCNRNTGQPVYNALSELVGLYVEVAV